MTRYIIRIIISTWWLIPLRKWLHPSSRWINPTDPPQKTGIIDLPTEMSHQAWNLYLWQLASTAGQSPTGSKAGADADQTKVGTLADI